MASTYPDLQLSLSLSDEPADLIDGAYDLSIRIGSTLDTSSIIGRKIGIQNMNFYAATNYCSTKPPPQSLDELASHPLILYTRDAKIQRPNTLSRADPLRKTTPKIQSNDLDVLLEAALQAIGIALLPEWLASPYVASAQLQHLAKLGQKSFDIIALWPQNTFIPARTRQAIEHIMSILPGIITPSV
ncbi:transcriptional regulator [Neokomagataea thailandica NBRC 106555]|nr:transcriptional regulator [Neokomagataea thailandica NBRC 106555]